MDRVLKQKNKTERKRNMNEMRMTLKIDAPELTAAVIRLAGALEACGAAPGPAPQTAPAAPANPAAPPAPDKPRPDVPLAPVSTAPPAPAAPAPDYTVSQLGRAGAELIAADPAKREPLTALLKQFGVPAITMLPPEQYGAFAAALRGLGAKL